MGDSASDIAAGRAMGLRTVLVTSPESDPYPDDAPRPTATVPTLLEAVRWILAGETSAGLVPDG